MSYEEERKAVFDKYELVIKAIWDKNDKVQGLDNEESEEARRSFVAELQALRKKYGVEQPFKRK